MPGCSRCGAERSTEDNFCRRCGRELTVDLPVLRQERLPVRAQVIPPSLVGSIAVLAVGSSLEWLARRFAGTAARAAGRALVSPIRASVGPARGPSEPVPEEIDEFLYVRKVRLRR
jgi:hypothetical protein